MGAAAKKAKSPEDRIEATKCKRSRPIMMRCEIAAIECDIAEPYKPERECEIAEPIMCDICPEPKSMTQEEVR
jgi:hypothetical protein